MVHNETSTGVCSRVDLVRAAIDRAAHPALLIVDTISSLGSIDYRHQEWGVDVTIGGSQKGLMLPPGLGFNALSEKALDAHQNSRLPKSFWDWGAVLRSNQKGSYPYTPATNLLYGLKEALLMLEEEGLNRVFERHSRLAAATRAAVRAWGLEICCLDPDCCSASLTTVLLPEGFDSDRLRALILNRFDLSLGTGLGKLSGRAFRIGHLGSMNDLMLAGTLCGIEMGLQAHGVPFQKGGVSAAWAIFSKRKPDRDDPSEYSRESQAFGANPSPMALAEVFVALQTGVMDGQEHPFTHIYTSRFHEVQTHLSITQHVYTPAYLTVGKEQWNELPPG